MAGQNGASPLTDAGNWLGVLVAGLAGAFTFVGLSGDELATVLRNEAAATTWVFAVLALTVVAAVVSVFVAGKKPVDLWVAAGVLLVAASFLAFTVPFVPVPATPQELKVAGWVVGGVLVVSGLILFSLGWCKRKQRGRTDVPIQALWVLAAVLLLAAGVFGGVRAEVRSQSSTTHVRLEPKLSVDDHGASLGLALAASKLPVDNFVIVTVYAVERSVDLQEEKPCRELPNVNCQFIAGYRVYPDALGKVDDKLTVRIDQVNLQHLALKAVTCRVARHGDETFTECSDRGGPPTEADVRIPAPPPPPP